MSFSWMKPTTPFLSRALITALSLSIALNTIAPTLIGDAKAEPIADNGVGASNTSGVSYAQQISEGKEQILTLQEEIEQKTEELERNQKDLKSLSTFGSWDKDGDSMDKYSAAKCHCDPTAQCTIAALEEVGAIQAGDETTSHISTAGGKADGPCGIAKDDCHNITTVNPKIDQVTLCTQVYDFSQKNSRTSTSKLNAVCVAQAKRCGAVKRAIDEALIPDTIENLKKEIALLTKKKRKFESHQKIIIDQCPHCADIAENVAASRPGLGDYIVGGLQAISPMVIAGIQAG